MKIYHNPRCSKSRETLSLIREQGEEPEIVEYLKEEISEKELKELIAMLGIRAEDLVRKIEDIYKTKYKGKNLSDAQWIRAMVAHPVLIERPIVVQGKRAVIGRPPQLVLDLIAGK
jgi:arsenate reductase